MLDRNKPQHIRNEKISLSVAMFVGVASGANIIVNGLFKVSYVNNMKCEIKCYSRV